MSLDLCLIFLLRLRQQSMWEVLLQKAEVQQQRQPHKKKRLILMIGLILMHHDRRQYLANQPKYKLGAISF